MGKTVEFQNISPLLREAFEQLKKELDLPRLKLGEGMVSGGYGTIYRVTGGDGAMVMKVIDTTVPKMNCSREELYARAQMEQRAMVICRDCPYIMPLLGQLEYVDEEKKQGVFLLLMPELIPLEGYLAQYPLNEPMIRQLMADLCRALVYMEEHQLLHRDINPNNVYVQLTETGPRFILGDLGIVRLGVDPKGGVRSGEGLTQIGTRGVGVGIPPETRKGLDPKGLYNSDLWLLGNLVLTLIREDEDSSLFSELPLELLQILQKATKEDPWERYLHAADMLAALETQVAVVELPADLHAARDAFERGHLERAMEIAKRCHQNGSTAGTRVYAFLLYCYCSLHFDDALAEFRRREGPELLSDLWYDEEDYAARALYAIIMLSAGEDPVRYAKDVKEAAEHGCVFAEHYYAGWLYNGKMQKAGIPRNEELAVTMVSRAVEKYYMPARYLLKKILSRTNDPFIVGRDESFLELLSLELEDQPDNFEQLAMLNALM